jgi:hypothetical protein
MIEITIKDLEMMRMLPLPLLVKALKLEDLLAVPVAVRG